MHRTNRIEPVNIDPRYLARAVLITTTQLEIIRQVEIKPTTEPLSNRRRSETDRSPSSTSIKPSRKLFWCIGCLFFTAGLLALSIVIAGFIIIFQRMRMVKNSNIERYDLGDLHYGISNVTYPSNTFLSHMNKASIQNYLSEQLRNVPGFRGIIIEDVFVQDKPQTNQRTRREISCSIIFIIQNIQVYFDHCSTCINQRNGILRRLFFDRTAFNEPLYLLLNNRYFFARVCSIPNISHWLLPQRLDLTDLDKIMTRRKSIPHFHSSVSNDIDIDTSTTEIIATSERSSGITANHLSTEDITDRISTEETSPFNVQTSTESSTTFLEIETSTESSTTSLEIQTSTKKPSRNLFEFLPHRPSTTFFPWRYPRSLSRLISQR